MTFDFISCQKSKVLSSTVESQKPTTRMASLPPRGSWRGLFLTFPPPRGSRRGAGGAGEGLL